MYLKIEGRNVGVSPHSFVFSRIYKKEIRKILLLLFLWSCTAAQAKDVVITVSNATDMQRHEVVSMDARQVMLRLELRAGQPLQVFGPRGAQVDCQITHDSLLLIDAAVRPRSSVRFTVRPGEPEPMRTWVTGARYPQRMDDIAWENDRCAYRVYGPALQASGEQSFGTDVWVKNTPELVVAERYRLELEEGVSYHVDHGNGLDAYQVGPTLGCGTPALMMPGDSLVMPWCYKDCEILDNGPLRFTVRLDYAPTQVGRRRVTEHRIIQLDKGSHLNRITVWYDGLKNGTPVAAGFVVHQSDTTQLRLTEGMALYADPTDNPDGNGCQIYVGALFPEDAAVRYLPLARPRAGACGHAVGVRRLKAGERYTYYAGAAWSAYDVRSMDEWQLRLEHQRRALADPLAVTLQ